MTALLFYGDTERSPAMRHELPVTIGDPFLLGIVEGRLHVMASGLDRTRIEVRRPTPFSTTTTSSAFASLLESGMSRHEVELELASRAAAAMGIRVATADPTCLLQLPTGCEPTASSSIWTRMQSLPGVEEVRAGAGRRTAGAGRRRGRDERRRGAATAV